MYVEDKKVYNPAVIEKVLTTLQASGTLLESFKVAAGLIFKAVWIRL